jgi:AcrR family transcriptional regulator
MPFEPGGEMPQVKPAADPKQRILDVATEAFAREGYAGARVDEIARKAGINKAMLYYHVGDKDALYAAVFTGTMAEARKRLEAAAASIDGPEERFRSVVRAMARMANEHPHFAPLMLREIASGGAALPDAVVAQMRSVFQVLADVLADGVKKKTFRNIDPLMTHMFIGGSLMVLISGAPLRRRVRGTEAVSDRAPDDIAAYVADLLLGGLRRSAPPSRTKKPATKPRAVTKRRAATKRGRS